MRIWWYLLALIFGFLASIIVLLWPVKPFWMVHPTEPARVVGISPDGTTIYTSHLSKDGTLFMVRSDARTGQELHRTEIQDVNAGKFTGTFTHSIRLSRDAKTIFIGLPVPGPDIYSWYLHDAETGKRYAGPIMDIGHFNPVADSADGRWFWVYHGIRGKTNLNEGLDILSMRTGQRVLELRDKDGMRPGSLKFSPDGETAAVTWSSTDAITKKKHVIVAILELPSGKEGKRIELPDNKKWGNVNRWDGRYLWLEYHLEHPDYPGRMDQYWLRRSVRFDTAKEPICEGEEEPLLSGEFRSEGQTWWDEGDNWVAYQSFVKPEQFLGGQFQQWQNWAYDKLGWKRPTYDLLISVQVVNRPSGIVRYQLPFPVGYPAYFSKDGSRLACRTKDGDIAVYDLDPPSRWPWTLAASLGTLLLILLVGRWRTKRLARSSIASSPTT